MTLLIYFVSTLLVMVILVHALYTMVRDGKRSLSSDGEMVRHLSRRQKTFNLKRVKKALFFRKLKYTITFITGAVTLCAVIMAAGFNGHIF